MPECSACGHPFTWHGDRAVCPCDGGWPTETGPMASYHRGGTGPRSVCGCQGYQENPVTADT